MSIGPQGEARVGMAQHPADGLDMLCTLLCYAVFRVIWCTLLIPVFQTMRAVYLSYDVNFFLMLALLLPVYRRSLSALAGC